MAKFMKRPIDKVEAERIALAQEIRKHRQTIGEIEKVLGERKELGELESLERKERFMLEHPKLASAGRKLKSLLGSTNEKLEKAKNRYKAYAKKHPYKPLAFK
jgi:hypothetical protein